MSQPTTNDTFLTPTAFVGSFQLNDIDDSVPNFTDIPKLSTEITPPVAETAKPIPVYKHEELRDALMMAYDYLERSDIPFVLWGKTLEHVMNNEEELTGDDKIEFATKRSEVVDGHISILDHWARNVIVTDKTIEFKCNNIPVVVHIRPTDDLLLQNPDTVNYWIESFKAPNPYSEYLKRQ